LLSVRLFTKETTYPAAADERREGRIVSPVVLDAARDDGGAYADATGVFNDGSG